MNFKNLAVTAMAAALPFAFTQEANAAPSDCWWGLQGVRDGLRHSFCDVERYEDHTGPYYVVLLGNEEVRVDLWENNGAPTVATVNAGTAVADFPWKIDGDGDVRISMGNKALVFRFPDHPQAGTGAARINEGGRGTAPAGRDGLQQGDLSDTPFRF